MTDAFELLGLAPTALLERAQLDAAVRAQVAALGTADSPEKREALNLAAAELKSSVKRCRLLMARSGWSGTGGPSDPGMLAQVFALRERIANARATRELGEICRVAEVARSKHDQLLVAFESCRSLNAEGAEAASARAASIVDELHYLGRVLDEAHAAEDAIDGSAPSD
jgi:hypothetical protein